MDTEEMTRDGVRRGVRLAMFGIVAVTVFGLVVKALWNALMPTPFGPGFAAVAATF